MEKEKSMEKDLNYPLKLWVCTFTFGSLFLSVHWLLQARIWQDLTSLIIAPFISIFSLVGFSFLFSLPALIVVWLIYRGVLLLNASVAFDKTATIILAIASAYATERVILGSLEVFTPIDLYIIAIPFSALFLHLRLLIRNRRKAKTQPVVTVE